MLNNSFCTNDIIAISEVIYTPLCPTILQKYYSNLIKARFKFLL